MIRAELGVIGGGPAGAALAGLLARRGHRVLLVDGRRPRDTSESPRGESLGPELVHALERLGDAALGAALEDCRLPHRGVRLAWGGPALEERASILQPLGEGWHVDRARFDRVLLDWARRGGARLELGGGRWSVRRADRGVTLRGPAETAELDLVVDASGRGAPGSAGLGRRWLSCDRQVAVLARATAPRDDDSELELEAVEDGWWYSLPQPGGGLCVAFVTDADLLGAGRGRALAAAFDAALARTEHTRRRVGDHGRIGPVRVVRADGGALISGATGPLWAVGDAALAVDPLSGQGVVRAIESASSIVPALERALAGDEAASPPPPHGVLPGLLDTRARHCALETRWPEAPFWRRRRPGAWRQRPVRLHPEARLRAGVAPSASSLAPVEALIPPRPLRRVLARLADAPSAHVLLAGLRAEAPLGDRRLLAGLEALVDAGLARTD